MRLIKLKKVYGHKNNQKITSVTPQHYIENYNRYESKLVKDLPNSLKKGKKLRLNDKSIFKFSEERYTNPNVS